jgi:NAD(P)H-flavin reductase
VGASFLKNLKPGDEVKFLGPLGQFVVAPEPEKERKLLFVGTGSGIAPLRSMIRDLLEDKQDERRIQLYWGLRYVKDMFWVEEFRQTQRYFANFNFHLSLSKPPELWPLCSGHVTECVKTEVKLGSDWGVYLCGNQAMIKEASELVEKMGVPKEQVHFEKFF